MDKKILEKIILEVKQSKLSEKDKLMAIEIFSKFSEIDAEFLLELIMEDENIIQLLSNNIKLKQGISYENEESWREIIRNEEETLSSF